MKSLFTVAGVCFVFFILTIFFAVDQKVVEKEKKISGNRRKSVVARSETEKSVFFPSLPVISDSGTGQGSEEIEFDRLLEGIGEDFLPGNVHFDVIDEFVMVEDEESFHMTRALCQQEGIYAGGSCGAAVVGAIRYAQGLSEPKKILVILHDAGSKYASKVYNDRWMEENNFALDRERDEKDLAILNIIQDNGKLVE